MPVETTVAMGTRVPRTLIFDLDGTLTDPYAGISRSYLHALRHIGREPLSEAALRDLIGPPMQDAFATLCGDQAEHVPAAIAAYRERYARVGLFENVVYDGIPEALSTLAERYRLYVCTSKPQTFAVRILEHFNLAHYFQAIYGSELDGTRADKDVLLGWLLEHEPITPSEAVMIGDRKFDIAAALANGLAPVAVLWGYGSEAELRAAGASRFVATTHDLGTTFTP